MTPVFNPNEDLKILYIYYFLLSCSVSTRFFVGYGLELSRLVPFIIFHLKRKYLCKTEAEVKEAWFPGEFGYISRVPGDLLIITIVLCYSVIAPIILPFGVLYFAFGWLILRNQVMHINKFFSSGMILKSMILKSIHILSLMMASSNLHL